MNVIILAGGGGVRLWPLSTHAFPKQFLHLTGEDSLLQATVRRFVEAPFVKRILVATSGNYEELVQKQLQRVDPEGRCEVLVEPCRKNTGAAIAFAVRYLVEVVGVAPSEPILVLPSDHVIEPRAVFLRSIEQAVSTVSQGRIVLFGIRPTKPETGFGYIRVGQPFDHNSFHVLAFIEKPSVPRALGFIKSREYYWNAGIFGFTASSLFEELQIYAPRLGDSYAALRTSYHELPDSSIDYALMEKTQKLVVCPLAVEWSDVGSWDSVYEMMEKDHNHNAVQGNVLAIDTKNSLILGGKKLISTIGLEDLLIVETEDAIFISKKGASQRVKELVQALNDKKNF